MMTLEARFTDRADQAKAAVQIALSRNDLVTASLEKVRADVWDQAARAAHDDREWRQT